jgi:hypothetical protein
MVAGAVTVVTMAVALEVAKSVVVRHPVMILP